MSTNLAENQDLRRYLLGQLADETALQQIEERILEEADFQEEMAVAESALIDEYVMGALPEGEIRAFEQYFLAHPARRQALSLAQSLRRYALQFQPAPTLRRQPARQPWHKRLTVLLTPPSRALLLAVTALLLLGAFVAVWRYLSPQPEPERLVRQANDNQNPPALTPTSTPVQATASPTATPSAAGSPRATPLPRVTPTPAPRPVVTPPPNPPPIIAALLLQPGGTRGSGRQAQELFISPQTQQIRLTLVVPKTDFASFRAVLQTAEGTEVLQQTIKPGTKGPLGMAIPGQNLAPGDYVIRLYGLRESQPEESVTDYVFRATKQH